MNKDGLRKVTVLERLTAGVSLVGSEVKAIKAGRLQIRGSYIKFIGNDLYWVNASIPQYIYSHDKNYDPQRSRRLLITNAQRNKWIGKIRERNLTVIPVKCYTIGSLIKLEIALSKGKKTHDIKAVEKARETERKEKQNLKEYLKK